MKKKVISKALHLFMLSGAMLAAVSCQAFFSTSLAPWAARESYPIPADMTSAEVSALLQTALAQNNPALADALLPQLLEAAKSAAPGPEQDALLNELFSATLLSSGIGTSISAILPSLVTVLSGGTDGAMDALAGLAASLASTTLSDTELASLAEFAANPPADADPNTMLLAAGAVILISVPDVELTPEGLETLTPDQQAALLADPGVTIGLSLAEQALALATANGEPILIPFSFGDL